MDYVYIDYLISEEMYKVDDIPNSMGEVYPKLSGTRDRNKNFRINYIMIRMDFKYFLY